MKIRNYVALFFSGAMLFTVQALADAYVPLPKPHRAPKPPSKCRWVTAAELERLKHGEREEVHEEEYVEDTVALPKRSHERHAEARHTQWHEEKMQESYPEARHDKWHGYRPLPEEKDSRYIQINGGYSHMFYDLRSGKNKTSGGLVGSIGAGYVLSEYFRMGITGNYRGDHKYLITSDTKAGKQKMKSTSMMLNGYGDISASDRVKPYLMAGVGLSINRLANVPKIGDSRTSTLGDTIQNFSWQVGVGTRIKLYKSLYADMMYKYVDLGKVKTRDVEYVPGDGGELLPFLPDHPTEYKGTVRAHEVTIGFVVNF